MVKHNLTIKKLNYINDNSFNTNYLKVSIKGDDINYAVINTIRRITMDEIPSYAISEIDIEKNTSVYNNDYMRNRIENIPLVGLDLKLNIDDYKKLSNGEIDESDNNFVIHGNNTNNSINVINVTLIELL